MKVIITRELAIAHPNYIDPYGCPLWHAIRQQYPDYPLIGVAGTAIHQGNGLYYRFNHQDWSASVLAQLIEGEIDSVEIYVSQTPEDREMESYRGL